MMHPSSGWVQLYCKRDNQWPIPHTPETRYAQIEKELLAIVFACERFYAYIYGRDVVHVESDHQPLETIMQKLLHEASKQFQCMLLQLQKYSLDVRYKKGKHIYHEV